MTTFTQNIGGTSVAFDLTVAGGAVSGTVTPEGGDAVVLNGGRARFPVAASATDSDGSPASIAVKAHGDHILVTPGRVGYADAFKYNIQTGVVTLTRQPQDA